MGISPTSIAISREARAVCGIATGFASSVSPSQWTTLSTSSEPKPPQGNHFSRWVIRPVLFAPIVLLGGEKCRVWHRIGRFSRARSKPRGRDYKLSVNTIIIVAHQLLLLPAIQLLRQTLFKRWAKSTQQPFLKTQYLLNQVHRISSPRESSRPVQHVDAQSNNSPPLPPNPKSSPHLPILDTCTASSTDLPWSSPSLPPTSLLSNFSHPPSLPFTLTDSLLHIRNTSPSAQEAPKVY